MPPSFYEVMQMLVTIFVAVMASSGFWGWYSKRNSREDASTKLILGLAHDRIIQVGMKYIHRGWITKDEYEDFQKYLYDPYSEFGGNGLAYRVWSEIQDLKIYRYPPSSKDIIDIDIKRSLDETQ